MFVCFHGVSEKNTIEPRIAHFLVEIGTELEYRPLMIVEH
jgi:hypothetical protein